MCTEPVCGLQVKRPRKSEPLGKRHQTRPGLERRSARQGPRTPAQWDLRKWPRGARCAQHLSRSARFARQDFDARTKKGSVADARACPRLQPAAAWLAWWISANSGQSKIVRRSCLGSKRSLQAVVPYHRLQPCLNLVDMALQGRLISVRGSHDRLSTFQLSIRAQRSAQSRMLSQ